MFMIVIHLYLIRGLYVHQRSRQTSFRGALPTSRWRRADHLLRHGRPETRDQELDPQKIDGNGW